LAFIPPHPVCTLAPVSRIKRLAAELLYETLRVRLGSEAKDIIIPILIYDPKGCSLPYTVFDKDQRVTHS